VTSAALPAANVQLTVPASDSPLVSTTSPGKLIFSWKSALSAVAVVRSAFPLTSTRPPERRRVSVTAPFGGLIAEVSAPTWSKVRPENVSTEPV
jgi:hypothetical protein